MKLVVLISGGGSNLQAIINAITDKTLKAEIVLVVSNKRDAYGLERAKNAGIPTLYHPLKPFTGAGKSRLEYDASLAEQVLPYAPDYVVLAGWMHILSPAFLDHFPRQVINLHPALYGTFDGTGAIERAHQAFQEGIISHSGCMVHYAIPKVDAGEVILQANVPIYATDTLADFDARMHTQEHETLVQALHLLEQSLRR